MEVIAVITPDDRTFAQLIKFVKDPREFRRISVIDNVSGYIFKGHFLMWDADKIKNLDELLYWIEARTKVNKKL